MLSLRKALRRATQLDSVEVLRQVECVLGSLMDTFPSIGSRGEHMDDLIAFGRVLNIVHMLIETGESRKKIESRLNQKEAWFKELENNSPHDPKGLFVEGDICVSVQ